MSTHWYNNSHYSYFKKQTSVGYKSTKVMKREPVKKVRKYKSVTKTTNLLKCVRCALAQTAQHRRQPGKSSIPSGSYTTPCHRNQEQSVSALDWEGFIRQILILRWQILHILPWLLIRPVFVMCHESSVAGVLNSRRRLLCMKLVKKTSVCHFL